MSYRMNEKELARIETSKEARARRLREWLMVYDPAIILLILMGAFTVPMAIFLAVMSSPPQINISCYETKAGQPDLCPVYNETECVVLHGD